jgi:hypothetical protein
METLDQKIISCSVVSGVAVRLQLDNLSIAKLSILSGWQPLSVSAIVTNIGMYTSTRHIFLNIYYHPTGVKLFRGDIGPFIFVPNVPKTVSFPTSGAYAIQVEAPPAGQTYLYDGTISWNSDSGEVVIGTFQLIVP